MTANMIMRRMHYLCRVFKVQAVFCFLFFSCVQTFVVVDGKTFSYILNRSGYTNVCHHYLLHRMNWLNIPGLANSPENTFSPSLCHRRGSGAIGAVSMPHAALARSKQPHTNEYAFITGGSAQSNFSADNETIESNWIVVRLEFQHQN